MIYTVVLHTFADSGAFYLAWAAYIQNETSLCKRLIFRLSDPLPRQQSCSSFA